MKKISFLGLALCGMVAMGLTSCSDDNTNGDGSVQLSEQDQQLQSILKEDIEKTINPTYAALADSCTQLYDQLIVLREASRTNSVKQEDVDKACEIFLHSRANYERSEAFLLGAADHFGIDPHIDSWPLDLDQLTNLLNSDNMLDNLDFTDPSKATTDDQKQEEIDALNNAHGNFGSNLLGFHGIEFILFRDGKPRTASELNSNGTDSWSDGSHDLSKVSGKKELVYAVAVAGDLKAATYCMECSWNAEAPQAHKEWLENMEWWGTTTDSGLSYEQYYVNAGQAGAASSIKNAVSSFLIGDKGAKGIADEVGNTKISSPFTGADKTYIESPYSKNSKTDFTNNIRSIENTWYGGIGVDEVKNAAGLTASNRGDNSFHAYFAKNYPEEGKAVEEAIVAAKKAIQEINGKGAFVDYIHNGPQKVDAGKSGQAAIDACQALSAALDKAAAKLQ